jgi:hypothetical protein
MISKRIPGHKRTAYGHPLHCVRASWPELLRRAAHRTNVSRCRTKPKCPISRYSPSQHALAVWGILTERAFDAAREAVTRCPPRAAIVSQAALLQRPRRFPRQSLPALTLEAVLLCGPSPEASARRRAAWRWTNAAGPRGASPGPHTEYPGTRCVCWAQSRT